MPSATEQVTKVEEQLIETLAALQKPIVEAVRTLTEKTESLVPETARKERLSALDGLVASQFDFAERLLANQKDFVEALIGAIRPTATRAADTEPRAEKATRATKAAA